jgi:two-component system nitrogen regulation sensor histidine kinase GlnL
MTPTSAPTNELPILDHLSTAVLCLDDRLNILYLNAAAEQLLGISARKAVGQRLRKAVALPESLFMRLHEATDDGHPCTDRQVCIEPHGLDAVIVDCAISPYRHDQQRRGLILEIDAIDRPLRIARDEAMLAQQEHARSLLRGLAHEIKNPLGGLRGAAQLLERQLPDPELRDYTSIIIREADRLQNLRDRMLGPNSRPQREVVNVHEVLEHVRKIAMAGAPPDVRLQFDYDPSIPEFISDRDRLVQVFLNIAGNALEAVGDSANITFRTRVISNFTISTQRHRLVASVEICDDGPGVPETLLDQIFYPMVTGTDHGTGLGLSIAQSMMNQIGGLIECRSEPGNTVFTVLTPLEVA